jgi:hypothetical protein
MSRLAIRNVVHAVVFVTLSFAIVFAAVAREWSDTTGAFKKNGEVISFDGKVARLAFDEGFTLNIPIDKLSAADQAYLKKTYPDGKMAPAKGGDAKRSDAKKGVSKLELVGVAVAKPIANQSGEEAGLFSPGTHVRLLVSDPERNIVSLDETKSKVASFTDNKNTNLLGEDATAAAPITFEALSDGKSGVVTIHVPQVPAEKSVRLAVKGELHVVCGLGEAAETVRLPLNMEITLGF